MLLKVSHTLLSVRRDNCMCSSARIERKETSNKLTDVHSIQVLLPDVKLSTTIVQT